jgi:DNA-binding XRE family transcriptional regulator
MELCISVECTLKAVVLKATVRRNAPVKKTHKGPLRDVLAKNIRRLRAARGLSQEALAFSSGLNRTYLSAIERAERNVSIDNIARVAKGLQTDPWRLLKDE